jgi:hypothetical protein
MMTVMDWTSIVPAAITGVVGLGGIGGSLWQAKESRQAAKADLKESLDATSRNLVTTLDADDQRMHDAEKRRIYVAFNTAIENLWIVATSSEDFTTDPGRDHYNNAMKQLWSTCFEITLIAPRHVSDLVLHITNVMNQFASDLRADRSTAEPSDFDRKREELITAMRDDLGEQG